MPDMADLQRELARIDGRGYKAYNDLRGTYDFGRFTPRGGATERKKQALRDRAASVDVPRQHLALRARLALDQPRHRRRIHDGSITSLLHVSRNMFYPEYRPQDIDPENRAPLIRIQFFQFGHAAGNPSIIAEYIYL